MIIYFASGLVLTYGIMRMFVAVMGGNKTHDRLGSLINVFVYVIAVYLPFNYIIGVVLFGLGALFLLSISFEASFLMRLLATIATFAVLIAARAGLSFADRHIEGLVLFVITALVFFAASSFALDIRMLIDKKGRLDQIQDIQDKYEEEKNKLTAKFQTETNGLKNYTVQHLKNALSFLEVYKLADVEASIKDLIARNKTDKTDSEDSASIFNSLHEIKGLKKYTEQHLRTTLELLKAYKLQDVEASIKDLIARNKV